MSPHAILIPTILQKNLILITVGPRLSVMHGSSSVTDNRECNFFALVTSEAIYLQLATIYFVKIDI